MDVFEISVAEGYEWVQGVDRPAREVLSALDGSARRSNWNAVDVRLVTAIDEVPCLPADFPWLGSHALVLKRRTIDAVGSFLERFGELLPLNCVNCGAERLVVFNAVQILDALDEARSEIVRFPTGRVMTVTRYSFRPDVVNDAVIFRIPQLSKLFATESLTEHVHEHGLSGLKFEPVWRATGVGS